MITQKNQLNICFLHPNIRNIEIETIVKFEMTGHSNINTDTTMLLVLID